MKLSGFNYIGKYRTNVLATGDSIHVIYVLDNNICIGLCRTRFKRDHNPWFVAYGLNPFVGTYVTRNIADYPNRFESYQSAKQFIETIFERYHPEILVNNHIADRIANVYAQYCMETTGHGLERNYRGETVEYPYIAYHTPLARSSAPSMHSWLHSSLVKDFLGSDDVDGSLPTLDAFFDICAQRWEDYEAKYQETVRAEQEYSRQHPEASPHRYPNRHKVCASRPVTITIEDGAMQSFLSNQGGCAERRCDPND